MQDPAKTLEEAWQLVERARNELAALPSIDLKRQDRERFHLNAARALNALEAAHKEAAAASRCARLRAGVEAEMSRRGIPLETVVEEIVGQISPSAQAYTVNTLITALQFQGRIDPTRVAGKRVAAWLEHSRTIDPPVAKAA